MRRGWFVAEAVFKAKMNIIISTTFSLEISEIFVDCNAVYLV
jgi:hypothetical protein